jgi:putative CocE/NonD family hydrolase
MSTMSRLIARIARLPPAETYDVGVEKDLAIPMPDGVTLLADHYFPRNLGPRPTVMTRSVYADRTRGTWAVELYAERGFHVLVVSGRGTLGSGGELNPFRQEHDDGLAVLAWLRQQPWFTDVLGTAGASYLGYTQWAIARDAGSMLQAMSTQLIGSDFRSFIYPGDAFALETFQSWLAMVDAQERSLLRYLISILTGARRRRQALWHLPLGTLDVVTTGKRYPFWHDWLAHDRPDDPWWALGDHSSSVTAVAAPNHLVGGWYDFMLPFLLKDYWALVAAGQRPYLTIGPWLHTDAAASMMGVREALIWLRAHLLGDRRGLREAPVRIFVMGANVWRDLPGFPPAAVQLQSWYLQPGQGFAAVLPPDSAPDGYRFDPHDPTPGVGWAGRFAIQGRGAQDNRAVEARRDVLTYTSDPLERDTEIIGPVSAELFVRSSLEHTDFFVRLCDVAPSGKSLNVCDGLQRLFPGRPIAEADGCRNVIIELWPAAYRFKRGHRIRVQVASGSFPRWDRNLGSGESLATATTMLLAEQQVYHDPAHPSAIVLPLIP